LVTVVATTTLLPTTAAPTGAATAGRAPVCMRFSPAADQSPALQDGVLTEVSGIAADDAGPTTGVGKFPSTIITGADVSPDGSTVLVRTYRRVVAFRRPPGRALATAFDRAPCAAPQIDERQGEAVGFDANGASYFTVSEGAGASVHRFVVKPAFAR
jgi:hypothetical protein